MSPVQPHFNVLHGHAENIGDLLMAEIYDVSKKYNDASLLFRKKAKFILDTLGHLSLLQFLLNRSFLKVY